MSRNSSSALSRTFSNAAEGFYSLQKAPTLRWGAAVQLLKQQQQQKVALQQQSASGSAAAAAAGSAAFVDGVGSSGGGGGGDVLPAELAALLLMAVKHLACIAQVRGTVSTTQVECGFASRQISHPA
jgi:hypothetical protein